MPRTELEQASELPVVPCADESQNRGKPTRASGPLESPGSSHVLHRRALGRRYSIYGQAPPLCQRRDRRGKQKPRTASDRARESNHQTTSPRSCPKIALIGQTDTLRGSCRRQEASEQVSPIVES